MRQKLIVLVTVVLIAGLCGTAFAIGPDDLTDLSDPGLTADSMAASLGLGTPTNAVFKGALRSAGTFTNGLAGGIGINSGIVLTTGSLKSDPTGSIESVILGPNVYDVGEENLTGGDDDCLALIGTPVEQTTGATLYGNHCSSCHGALAASTKAGRTAAQIQAAISANTGGSMGELAHLTEAELQEIANALAQPTALPLELYDASVLTFDFTSETDVITFRFVFGSEEYPDMRGNDVFGLFIDGENVALSGGAPVSVHNLANIGGAASQLDGVTQVLTATARVLPGTHTLKLAIADAGPDGLADSAVFIQAATVVPGKIVVTPAVLDMGMLNVGETASQTVTITNTGASGVLYLGQISLSAGEFKITSDLCSNQSVAAEASCQVQVEFTPMTSGAKQAQLSIPSNDPVTPVVVSLSGGTHDTIAPAVVVTDAPDKTKGRDHSISGTVEAGIIPVVTANSPATVGAVMVNGETWSCRISGLSTGANTITVTATDAGGNVSTQTFAITVVSPDGCFDGTGTTKISDALKALRIAVNLDTATADDLLHGDVAPVDAPDDRIDATDALLILKKAIGLASF